MKIKISVLFISILFVLSINIAAQVEDPIPNPAANQNPRPFRLIQALGLTREQVQQIRRINQERKPIVMEAQRVSRIANRELDSAIYSDVLDEERIKELTKTAQIAQADLLKEKTITEYLIRKVLTASQLVRFRELREQMAERVNNRRQQMDQNPAQKRPIERLQQRRNQIKPR